MLVFVRNEAKLSVIRLVVEIWVTVDSLLEDPMHVVHVLGYARKLLEYLLEIKAVRVPCYFLYFYLQPLQELKHKRIVVAKLLDLKLLAVLATELGDSAKAVLEEALHFLLNFVNLAEDNPVEQEVNRDVIVQRSESMVVVNLGLVENVQVLVVFDQHVFVNHLARSQIFLFVRSRLSAALYGAAVLFLAQNALELALFKQILDFLEAFVLFDGALVVANPVARPFANQQLLTLHDVGEAKLALRSILRHGRIRILRNQLLLLLFELFLQL